MATTENTSPHLNAKRLAQALNRSVPYITAMKKAGYVFKYGTVTTLQHARGWLKAHPEFKCTQYFATHKHRAISPESNQAGRELQPA